MGLSPYKHTFLANSQALIRKICLGFIFLFSQSKFLSAPACLPEIPSSCRPQAGLQQSNLTIYMIEILSDNYLLTINPSLGKQRQKNQTLKAMPIIWGLWGRGRRARCSRFIVSSRTAWATEFQARLSYMQALLKIDNHPACYLMSIISALGRQMKAAICEFETSLVYGVSSRTARACETETPTPKTQQQTQENP